MKLKKVTVTFRVTVTFFIWRIDFINPPARGWVFPG